MGTDTSGHTHFDRYERRTNGTITSFIRPDTLVFSHMSLPNSGTISPLKLAYLGDAVYEIIIRTLIMERTGGPVKNLHKRTSELVNAGSQAKLILVSAGRFI